MREWNEYYKSLLGGVEWRLVREVSLTQTAYKIYASVVAARLRDEMEKKYLLPNQTGNDLNGG